MFDFDRKDIGPDIDVKDNVFGTSLPDRRDTDAPVRITRSAANIPIVKALAFILLVSLVLWLSYTLFVHPINKLNLQLWLSKNCTAEIYVQYIYDNYSVTGKGTVKIDENLFTVKIEDPFPQELTYYKSIDGELYSYSNESREWQKEDTDGFDDYSFLPELFKRKNYERVKGKQATWRVKAGVDVGRMEDLEFRHRSGDFTFTWSEGKFNFTVTVTDIGKTHVDEP